MGVVVAVPDRRHLDLPPRSLVLEVRSLSQQIGHSLREHLAVLVWAPPARVVADIQGCLANY